MCLGTYMSGLAFAPGSLDLNTYSYLCVFMSLSAYVCHYVHAIMCMCVCVVRCLNADCAQKSINTRVMGIRFGAAAAILAQQRLHQQQMMLMQQHHHFHHAG